MALIKCPECNKEISDTVKRCPECGFKLKKKKEKREPKILKTKKSKRIFWIILIVVILALLGTGCFLGYKYYILPLNNYKAAEALVSEKKFDEAIGEFEKLNDFKDSQNKVLETHYKKAEYLLETKSYKKAVAEFEAAGDYNDAADKVKEAKYQLAEKSDLEQAIRLYQELGNYQDSEKKLEAGRALKRIENAYKKCFSDGTSLSSDKKSIMVDSTDKNDYGSEIDIVTIISELNLPDSLFNEMCSTNALMGRQSEAFDYYEVSWSYHPDNGLDVIFKYKN